MSHQYEDVSHSIPICLSKFQIFGLHGKQDITLEFAGRTTIFIADNGSGKTTSLYFLQSILSGRLSNLHRFFYKKFILQFSDGSLFSVTPKDYEFSREAGMLRSIISKTDLNFNDILDLASKTREFSYEILRERSILPSVSRQMRVPSRRLYDLLLRIDHNKEDKYYLSQQTEISPVLALKEYISKNLDLKVVYLPTYRRVEQAIERVFQHEGMFENLKSSEIHFGMKDVAIKIDDATNQIKQHFLRSYGQISGQMLGQLAESKAISARMKLNLSDRNRVELVIRRVGNNVSENQRRVIMELFDSGRLLSNRHLAFFLSSLIESYEEVKNVDDSLQSYANVCNHYLTNKEMKYDTLNGALKIFESVTGDEIELDHLSSGEKQILGSMSELYLGADRNVAIIFDEPELSLSVEWQRQILIDMVASKRCSMLIAATHSPFLFENELDSFARPLRVHFNPNLDREKNNADA